MQLSPIQDEAWPAALADMKGGFAGNLNVYRVMAHHPELLRAVSAMRDHVMIRNSLSRPLMELAILRVAHRLGVTYAWAHHVVSGREAGLRPEEIAAVQTEDADWSHEPAAAPMLEAVDALVRLAYIPDVILTRLERHLSPQQVLDLIVTVGMYRTLAGIIESFEVPLDRGVYPA